MKKQCLEDPGSYINSNYHSELGSHRNSSLRGFPNNRLRANFGSYNPSYDLPTSGRFQNFQQPDEGRYSSLDQNYSLFQSFSTSASTTSFPLPAPPAPNSDRRPHMNLGTNSLLPDLKKGSKCQELQFVLPSYASAGRALTGFNDVKMETYPDMESEVQVLGSLDYDSSLIVKESLSPVGFAQSFSSAPPLLQNFSDIKISEGFVDASALGDMMRPSYTNCQASSTTVQSASDSQSLDPRVYRNAFPRTNVQSYTSLGPSLSSTMSSDLSTSAAPATLLNFRMRNMAPNHQSSPSNQYTPFMNPALSRTRFRLRMPGPTR